jgi:predicted acetylornithine/succinylornithine family transaminase/N-acetyl-ornithine/N-acetyl-lysine deacetylase
MIPNIELEDTHTGGLYNKRSVVFVKGSGALLWDAAGREYIDCAAGHGVATVGHARPEIAAALALQAQRLITCPESVYNDTRARFLSRLAQVTPRGLDHFFLCNSGTEAVEAALKLARLATGRTGIIAALRGFHGRTMGALSATWGRGYREPFEPLVPGVSHVRYDDLEAAATAIDDQTAAVIVELVQGEGGVHVASHEYVCGLADLCRERGALLIVDEVQTGFGRTGRMFASEHYDLSPDILCLAKAMAGGVPMGAVCLGPRVMESGRIAPGAHGSTFGGNPLACAAALATLDIIEAEALADRAATLGARAMSRLRGLESPLLREVRGLGLMIGIELRERAQPYLEALLARGVLALPAGPNVIRLLPPLVITEDQLDRAIEQIESVLGPGQDSVRTPGEPISDPGTLAIQNPEVDLLLGMLCIPSYSGQEEAFAHYLVEQATQMGLEAHIDEVGNFVASIPASSGAPHDDGPEQDPIVLLGHMDTVDGVVPVRMQDGLLYGRGAVDAKGPLAAFLCAAARVARSGGAPGALGRPVIVVGAVEEESATSRGARWVAERYSPLACIIGEPSGSQAVTIGYKGRLLVDYEVARPLAHSAGPDRTSSELAAAFWERVRAHAAEWNAEHSDGFAFTSLSPSLRNIDSTCDGLTDRAHCVIGYRLPPDFDVETLRIHLQRWAEEDGAYLQLNGEEPAFATTRATALARAFIKAIRDTGGNPTFKRKTGTSDMNVVGPLWGQNVVAYGPGDSRLDHTPQEHIRIDEYLHAIDVLERVLNQF